jgi:hypothetical protein
MKKCDLILRAQISNCKDFCVHLTFGGYVLNGEIIKYNKYSTSIQSNLEQTPSHRY